MTLENQRTPSLAEVISLAISQKLADVHVSLPGRIESYDASEQKADVKPLLKRPVRAEDGTFLEAEELPIIPDVPIVFPRGGGGGSGGYFISWPLTKGDHVHLVFNERSIDKFIDATSSGGDTDPVDLRTHNLSDAVAYPGFYPFSQPLADAHTDNMVIGEDSGCQIHIKPSGEIHIGSENAAEFVAQAAKTLSELSAIVSGFNSHVHAGVMAGAASTAPPTSPLASPGSVASGKVKVD